MTKTDVASGCIFVTGPPGSGKSTFGAVATNLGCSVLDWGEFIASKMPASGNRAKRYSEIARLVELYGIKYFPDMMYAKLIGLGQFHVVVGARNPIELNYFTCKYKKSHVVWIEASIAARYKRIIERNRCDAPISLEQFYIDDSQEMMSGLETIKLRLSNEYVENEGDVISFEASAKALIKSRFGADFV